MPVFGRLPVLAVVLVAALSGAQAQQYPNRPVHVLVGYAAGSGPDIQARTVAQQLGESLHQSFLVENRLGANGTIAARAVATAIPDGYTLLFSSSSITPTPYIYRRLGYDVLTDIKPIATVGELDGMFMLVDAKSLIRSVSEFIAHAESNHVFYGSPGVGNILHLATEAFSQKAGIKLEHVAYKGASEVMTGLLSGTVQVMFVTPPSVMGLLQEGRVRALAFTGTKPFPLFPDVPLMKDLVQGYEPMGSWGMFFAPGKTPDSIVDTLNSAIREALRVPAVAGVIQRDGYIPDNRNAHEAQAFFRKEVQRIGPVIEAAGMKPE
jgi:tripartite-type tricarboxylate transporter receptor subunit TctC